MMVELHEMELVALLGCGGGGFIDLKIFLRKSKIASSDEHKNQQAHQHYDLFLKSYKKSEEGEGDKNNFY